MRPLLLFACVLLLGSGCKGARSVQTPGEEPRQTIDLGRIVVGWSLEGGSGFTMGVDVVLVGGAALASPRPDLVNLVQTTVARRFRPEDVRRGGFLARLRTRLLAALRRRFGPDAVRDVRLSGLGWC